MHDTVVFEAFLKSNTFLSFSGSVFEESAPLTEISGSDFDEVCEAPMFRFTLLYSFS